MRTVRRAALFLLALMCLYTGASAEEERTFTGFRVKDVQVRPLAEGITYSRYDLLPEGTDTDKGQRFHLVEVAPSAVSRVRLAAIPSGPRIHKGQKTPMAIFKNAEPETDGTILAGVNGDYFDVRSGGTVGHLKVNGRWLVAGEFPEGWSVGIDEAGVPMVGQPKVSMSLTLPDGTEVPINALNGLRKDTAKADTSPENVRTARRDNLLVLYTAEYWKATDTPGGGTEVVIDPEGDLTGGPLTAKVVRVVKRHPKGGTTLKKGRMVLSGTGDGAAVLRQLKAGDTVTITLTAEPPFDSAVGVLGGGRPDGGPLLMWQGRPTDLAQLKAMADDLEYFYVRHHALTVLALREDGGYFLLALDGYRPERFGMTVDDLQVLLCDLKAYTALNLDGGSSTAMAIRYDDRLHLMTDTASSNRQIPVSSALMLVAK